MKSGYLTTTPLCAAREAFLTWIRAHCRGLGSEVIPVMQAHGRVLARAVYAHLSAPHFYASAMDGVAMRAKDGFGATPTTPVKLTSYEEVDTGDPIPKGCDCVVMVEDVLQQEDGWYIAAAPTPWQHVRQIGEDICQSEMAFPTHTLLTPACIGALVSCGVAQVEVVKRPLVGILPTGDEIVPPTPDPRPGELLEFNSLIFSGMLSEWGMDSKTYDILPDDMARIRQALAAAARACDFLLLIAGSSKGRGDFAEGAIAAEGEVLLHGVAIRPGKPALLGRVGEVPIVGLPGYPVSGVVVMQTLVQPALRHMAHLPQAQSPVLPAALSRKVVSPLQYEEFVRCKVAKVGDRYVAMPLGSGAAIVSSFAKADAVLCIPQDREGMEAGEVAQIELLRPVSEIARTICVCGSHDPLFDELADVIERMDVGAHLASSHVGSMGGILAMLRGENHAAGIHLLDPATGEYNLAYLKRYFPGGGVKLLRGVGRVQGLMVAKGNPLGVSGVEDLAREGLRYVNRQKGAGTRVLLDYLLDKKGIAPASLYGYEREEMTHLAVAVQIASGSADAGLGVYAAAKAFGLDFVPVYTEQYDILVSDMFCQDPLYAVFCAALTSEEMAARLERLGGYTLDGLGKEIPIV